MWHSWRVYTAEQSRLAPAGKAFAKPWHELIRPRRVDARSGDEIAMDTIRRLGLEVKAGEPA